MMRDEAVGGEDQRSRGGEYILGRDDGEVQKLYGRLRAESTSQTGGPVEQNDDVGIQNCLRAHLTGLKFRDITFSNLP